jgi:hypothetical protein
MASLTMHGRTRSKPCAIIQKPANLKELLFDASGHSTATAMMHSTSSTMTNALLQRQQLLLAG